MKKDKPKKVTVARPKPNITKTTAVIYMIIAVTIGIAGVYVGTVMDYSCNTNGEFIYQYLNDAMAEVNQHVFLNQFHALRRTGSYARTVSGTGLFAWMIFVLYKYSQEPRRTHRKGVEHGSAKWGDDKEKKSLNEDNATDIIVMKDSEGNLMYDEKGEILTAIEDKSLILSRDVKLSLNTWPHGLNLNVLIVGGAGSGKTRTYAMPNIMQLSTSYVITDPKGEILQTSGHMLEQAGYKVRVLNLIEMNHSNNYNPFHYVYDQNGNLSEDYIKKMVDCLFKNTKGDGEKTDFWAQKGQSLLEAIVFLLFEESEYNSEFEEYEDSTGKTVRRIKPETRDLSHLNFFAVTEKMRKLQYPPKGSTQKRPDGFFMERLPDETEEDFRKRQNEGFLCPLDKDFIELEKRKGDTLAGRLYKEVRNAPEETGQSFLSSANVKTFFFNLTNLRNLTCCDNIHLETLGDEKTALFILIPATSRTYNFVAAMMYTQMFDVLSNRANFKYGGVLPVHVRCIMDEFYNIGEIPDFDIVMGFVRSMGISLNVILQNLAQIKSKYEKTWEIITGNCSSFLFLGGTEDSTLEYVSKQLGKETIDVRSLNKTKGKSPSTSESNSIMGRELMMPNEIKTMPSTECILSMQYHNPFYCNKYMQENHTNFKFLAGQGINDSFLVSGIHSVTVEEFEQQYSQNRTEEKVDTGINLSKTVKSASYENSKQIIAEAEMTDIFHVEEEQPESEKTINIEIPVSDGCEEDDELSDEEILSAITNATSETIEEDIIHFGDASETPESINFDELPIEKRKGDINDENIDRYTLGETETENRTYFNEINEKKEEIILDSNTEITAENSFNEININEVIQADENQISGYFDEDYLF